MKKQVRVGKTWYQNKKGEWKQTKGYKIDSPEEYSIFDSNIMEWISLVALVAIVVAKVGGVV